MRNEILKWLKEEIAKPCDANKDYCDGINDALDDVIRKINSIPVPKVEGYLEGKVFDIDTPGWDQAVPYDYALAALQSLAADKNEEIGKLNRWIPVEERLPELGQEVNVLTNKGVVTSLARFIRYEGSPTYYWDNNYGQGNTHLAEAITHWKPLPESPKQ